MLVEERGGRKSERGGKKVEVNEEDEDVQGQQIVERKSGRMIREKRNLEGEGRRGKERVGEDGERWQNEMEEKGKIEERREGNEENSGEKIKET